MNKSREERLPCDFMTLTGTCQIKDVNTCRYLRWLFCNHGGFSWTWLAIGIVAGMAIVYLST